jgi:type II secretory pathway component PulF
MSGSLAKILRQQAGYLKTIDDLQSRVVSALIYPAFIMSAGVGLIVLFMVVLVPQLESLFDKTGTTVPIITKLLIDSSRVVAQFWWVFLGVIVLTAVFFWQYTNLPVGRLWWDKRKLRLPLVGSIISSHFFAQFANTLANLVGNGIPLHRALELVSGATPNRFIKSLLLAITDMVGEGALLSRCMEKATWFPPLLIDMVAVGEQTGEMSRTLAKVAERYDKELTKRIDRLTQLIQPTIIVVMVVIVGVVIFSILSGIYQAIAGIHNV